jgi:hypothetical protein
MTPNRIVALGTGALGIIAAALTLAVDLTGPQAAGLAASALVVLGIAREWLVGWRAHEARQGEADQPITREDVFEQVRRLAPAPAAPEGLEWVASQLVEALAASAPVAPPAAPVDDPATEVGDDLAALAAMDDLAATPPAPGEVPPPEDPEALPPDERGAP